MLSAISLRAPVLRRAGLAGFAFAITALAPAQAGAQELVHRFINPSFGGNPFYSDHLLTIANIDRPAQPEDPADPAPTEEELLVAQLQSSLNSQLQSQILDRIRNAQPGQSGNFTLGSSQISFTKTATETRVTFVNSETGETKVIVIPVPGANTSVASNSTLGLSAEQLLGASGSSLTGLSSTGIAVATNGGSTGSLLGKPPLQ